MESTSSDKINLAAPGKATPESSGSPSWLVPLLLVFVVLVLVVAAYFYFNGNPSQTSVGTGGYGTSVTAGARPSPTLAVSSEATPSVSPLESGKTNEDIQKDLDSAALDSLDSDFKDLQKDVTGL